MRMIRELDEAMILIEGDGEIILGIHDNRIGCDISSCCGMPSAFCTDWRQPSAYVLGPYAQAGQL